MSDYHYVGEELALFQRAVNWKRYLRSQSRAYLGARVLEVGAGIGATTALLCDGTAERWVCLEPDVRLLDTLRPRIRRDLPACCEPVLGSLSGDAVRGPFDSILYVDVLEHIQDDDAELRRAALQLAPRGRIIVLAPAHQSLYTPFDKAIGHHRRYNKPMMRALTPPGTHLSALRYLDSIGLLASLANRLLLRQSMPTPRQIWVWDRLMVPLSRLVDPITGYSLGKSVIGVWQLRS